VAVEEPRRKASHWVSGSSGINNSPLKAMRQNIAFLNATLRTNVNDKKKRPVHSHMRFEAFLDPMNNWVVWDKKEQYFAEVGTRYLQSLPEEKAKAFCTMLNILFSRKDAGVPTPV
jgi:hypothetical protein